MAATAYEVNLGPVKNHFILAEELKDEPPTEWFVEKLFPHGGISLVFGPPNVGKSLLALDLSLRVAKGKNFGGRDTRSSDVLYVATEGARPALRDRLEAWRHLNQDFDPINNVMFYTRDIDILADGEGSLEHIIGGTMAAGLWPEFVVIDTLNFAFSGDENDNRAMGDVAKRLTALRTLEWHNKDGEIVDYNPTIIIVHHTPKSDFSSARGASALEGAIDSSINVQEDDKVEKLIVVWNKKNRYASKGSRWHYMLRDDEDGAVPIGATVEYAAKEFVEEATKSKATQCEDAVLAFLADGPKRNTDIERHCEQWYSKSTAQGAIKHLSEMKKIAKQSTSNRQSPWVLVDEKWRNRG